MSICLAQASVGVLFSVAIHRPRRRLVHAPTRPRGRKAFRRFLAAVRVVRVVRMVRVVRGTRGGRAVKCGIEGGWCSDGL